MKTLFLLSFVFALPLQAATLQCKAKVALNRVYDVQLDKATRVLEIKTDNGFHYVGNATYFYNPNQREHDYTIYYHYNLALQLSLEEGGQERVALCLTNNECYACK